MKQLIISIFVLFLLFATAITNPASGSELPISMRGYVRAMPGINLDKDFSDPSFYSIMHNRLNFRWDIASGLNLRLEGRNRLIYNEAFQDFPFIKDFFEQDDGLIDMSWAWLSEGGWIGHSEIDRLHLDWSLESWRIRVGRQRINWGINLVSNPNDLFNTYSFFDFDYPERPGADALRVQHFLGGLSSIEIAVSPARKGRESVAAAKYVYNWRGYDVQAVGGYYIDRLALGGGWAGHIGGAGFKGEATWFYDLEETKGIDRGNIVAAAGLDYMFQRGTFAVLEFLYNGGHERINQEAFSITEPLRPDNIMFSNYAITLSADRAFSPVFSCGLAVMALPDIDAAFVMPNMNYSVLTNLDMEVLAQLFMGGKNTIFEEAGYAFFASLKYSF